MDLNERLRRAAQGASALMREMAESKSLRQEGNTERRTDLYMWPTPEQTLEGQALAELTRLQSLLEEARRVVEPFAEALDDCGDEPEQADTRDLWDHPAALGVSLGNLRAARSFLDKLDGADGR